MTSAADPGTTPEPSSPGSSTSPLPLSVLDFVGIEYGEAASAAIAGAVSVAQAAEEAGYHRYWVSEHHNMASLACSSPDLLAALIGARTEHIRVGAAGVMLPNHAPFKVAETFRTLLAMHPGRVDLGLGRAPGTDPLTAHVLRRGLDTDAAAEFPGQVAELFAFLGDDSLFPADHPYRGLLAAPVVSERPQVFLLGSSHYGPRFAAANGLSAVFAHHQSPDLAVSALRDYRRDFAPRNDADRPWSALSVLAFAADDDEAVAEFEASWELTLANLARNVREPLRPEQVGEHARSAAFHSRRRTRDPRMATGSPDAVVAQLRDLKDAAQADELVVVTPGLDRTRRTASLRALADAWRATA